VAYDVVPDRIVASALDVQPAPQGAVRPADATILGEVPWWRPGTTDVARAIGWRWLILAPALATGIVLPMLPLFIYHGWLFAASTWKIWVTAWAIVVSMVAYGIRNVVKTRRDPFCIHCGYSLTGLAEEGQCPECGRLYHPSLIEEYRKDPHFFAHRHKMAGSHPPPVVFAAGEGATAPDGTS
jgi:hypothetical protein